MSQTHIQVPIQAPSLQAQPDTAELDAVFDKSYVEHLDAKTLDKVLTALLGLYPDAPASAVGEDTLLVAMPDSVPLQGNPVSEGRSNVDRIAFTSDVLAAWERMQAEGVARCRVHPVGRPEIDGMSYMLDLREDHGILFSLTVYDQADVAGSADGRPETPEAAPRFATIRKDARSVITKVDEAFTKILGWRAEDLQGHRSIEFIHPDDHPLAIDNWMEMLANPGPARRVRLRHRHEDGSWVWFEVTNHNQLDDPEQASVISELVDISEEMAAHEELRANKQLMDQLAATVPVGLLQFDVEHGVVYTNDRLHHILGVERAETVEAQLSTIVDEDRDTLERALRETLGEGRDTDIEVRLSLPRGLLRFCAVSVRALSFEDGTITGAIACVADVTDSARAREELKKRASFDELTSCYNRGSIMRLLRANIESDDREAERGVIFVDVDHFKSVNDEHGHAAGDEVLRDIAKLLQDAVRDRDMVGRVGGDEFLVVCPDIGGPDQAIKFAERLAHAALEKEISLATGHVVPKLSIGVAWSRGADASADAIVARADSAMYESKQERAGRPKLASETSLPVAAARC